MDKISIVITCHRKGEPLDRAFRSLELQTDLNFEVIIVNDASTDKQLNATCREIERQGKARVIWRKKRGGISVARNTGCRTISGDIYVPLDADDELPPNAIAAIRAAYKEAPEADFVFGNYIKNDVEKDTLTTVNTGCLCDSNGYLDPRELVKEFILYGGSPFRHSMWLKINGYDKSVKSGIEDVDFWLRALASGAKGKYVNDVLYIWHKSKYGMNAQISGNYWFYVNQVKNRIFYNKFAINNRQEPKILRILEKMPPQLSFFIITLRNVFNTTVDRLFLSPIKLIRSKLGLRGPQLVKSGHTKNSSSED